MQSYEYEFDNEDNDTLNSPSNVEDCIDMYWPLDDTFCAEPSPSVNDYNKKCNTDYIEDQKKFIN